MAEDDWQRLADHLEREARKLERHSEEVRDEIGQAHEDWQRKRADQSVPGADPPEEETADQDSPAAGKGSPG